MKGKNLWCWFCNFLFNVFLLSRDFPQVTERSSQSVCSASLKTISSVSLLRRPTTVRMLMLMLMLVILLLLPIMVMMMMPKAARFKRHAKRQKMFLLLRQRQKVCRFRPS